MIDPVNSLDGVACCICGESAEYSEISGWRTAICSEHLFSETDRCADCEERVWAAEMDSGRCLDCAKHLPYIVAAREFDARQDEEKTK